MFLSGREEAVDEESSVQVIHVPEGGRLQEAVDFVFQEIAESPSRRQFPLRHLREESDASPGGPERGLGRVGPGGREGLEREPPVGIAGHRENVG